MQTAPHGRNSYATHPSRHGEVSKRLRPAWTAFQSSRASRRASSRSGRASAGRSPTWRNAEREYVAMHCKPAMAHYALMLRKHNVTALGELLEAQAQHASFRCSARMPTVANRLVDILVNTSSGNASMGMAVLLVRRYKVKNHTSGSRSRTRRLGHALRLGASRNAAAAIRLLVNWRSSTLGLRVRRHFEAGVRSLLLESQRAPVVLATFIRRRRSMRSLSRDSGQSVAGRTKGDSAASTTPVACERRGPVSGESVFTTFVIRRFRALRWVKSVHDRRSAGGPQPPVDYSRAGLEDVRIHDLRHSCAVPRNFHVLNIVYPFMRCLLLIDNRPRSMMQAA